MKRAIQLVISSEGRANRFDIWVLATVFAVCGVLTKSLAESLEHHAASPLVCLDWIVAFFGFSIVLVGSMNLVVRRLQDRSKSGHWFLFFIILPMLLVASAAGPLCDEGLRWLLAYPAALLSLWSFAELFVFPGSRSENAYGKPPIGLQQSLVSTVGRLAKASMSGTVTSRSL